LGHVYGNDRVENSTGEDKPKCPVGEEISFEASNNNQRGRACGVEPWRAARPLRPPLHIDPAGRL